MSRSSTPTGCMIPPPPRRPSVPPRLLAAGGLLLAALVAVFFVLRKPAPAPTASPTVAEATPVPTPPAEAPVDLPALGESDAFVRDAAKGLSSHPQLGAWLAAPDLVRTLTVVVQNVADGTIALPLPLLPHSFHPLRRGPEGRAARGRPEEPRGLRRVRRRRGRPRRRRVRTGLSPARAAVRGGLRRARLSGDRSSRSRWPERSTCSAPPPYARTAGSARARCFLEFADPKLEALPLAQKHCCAWAPATRASSRARPRRSRRPWAIGSEDTGKGNFLGFWGAAHEAMSSVDR